MAVVTPEAAPVDLRGPVVWLPPFVRPLPERIRGWVRLTDTGWLGLICLPLYLFLAVWLRDHVHYFINDALSRTSDGVFITVGRDPHMGAIGFYWPPLPQLIQAPFVALLVSFGRSDLAGPLSSAVCTALTLPVLGRLCTRLGLGRGVRLGITAAFALNPVTLLYAANGMSEACSVLFLAIAMLGFLGFVTTNSTNDLVVMSVGLSGAVMCRLETPAVVAILAIVATFEWRKWHKLWTAALIALPPAACFIFWMAVQWVLLKSPLFFLHQNSGGAKKSYAPGAPNPDHHPWVALTWALHWILVLGPALILLGLLVIWTPNSPKVRGSLGILGAAAVFPAIQADYLLKHVGYANPRYFMTAVLFAAVAAAWMASSGMRITDRAMNLGLVLLLLVGAVTGSRALSSSWTTHIEGECHFILAGPAKVLPFLAVHFPDNSRGYCGNGQPLANGLASWQKLDAYLDRTLRPQDRVLTDNFSNFYAVLWTKHPDRFVVRNDRDWDKITANPTAYVDYIVTTGDVGKGGLPKLPQGYEDLGHTIVTSDPAGWKLVASFPGGVNDEMATATPDVYRYIGPKT